MVRARKATNRCRSDMRKDTITDFKQPFALGFRSAALMLGTDRSRGYCLEMTCADFLAGSRAQDDQRHHTDPSNMRREEGRLMPPFRQKRPRKKLDADAYKVLRQQVLKRDSWRCQDCGSSKSLQVHHLTELSQLGHDEHHKLIALCVACHRQRHRATDS